MEKRENFMDDQHATTSLPSMLKNLGTMTAIRDTYLLEQSLLRTLGSLLGMLDASFYRVDEKGEVIRVLHHFVRMTHQDEARSTVENVEEMTNAQDIPNIRLSLFASMRTLGKTCTQKIEGGLLIGYPIYGKGVLLAFFVFQREREVTPVEDAIIQGVLEVFTNYFDLLDTSQRDPLTGLLNRYSLEANLDRLWNLILARLHKTDHGKTKRVHSPEKYWLGMLDIDHFKKVNDTYGHIIGDEVLITTTRLLQASLRQSDLLYRYGGEEFVAVIAANDLESATHAFERTRSKIEQFQFPQVGQVTISGGFCSADPALSPKEVLNRADSALYAAKDAGRNRIYFYDALVKEGVLKEPKSGSIEFF